MVPQRKILGVIPVSLVNPTAHYCFQVSSDLLAPPPQLQQCFHYLSKYLHLQRMGYSTEHKYTANSSVLTKFPGFSPIQFTSCFRGFDNLPTLRICIQEGFLCWMCFLTLLLCYSHTEAMTHEKRMFYFNYLPSNIFPVSQHFYFLHCTGKFTILWAVKDCHSTVQWQLLASVCVVQMTTNISSSFQSHVSVPNI